MGTGSDAGTSLGAAAGSAAVVVAAAWGGVLVTGAESSGSSDASVLETGALAGGLAAEEWPAGEPAAGLKALKLAEVEGVSEVSEVATTGGADLWPML